MTEDSLPFYSIKGHGGLAFRFMPDGSLYDILAGRIMVNLFCGSLFDEAPANIYLRIISDEGIHCAPLSGLDSSGRITGSGGGLVSEGFFDEVGYRAVFSPLKGKPGWTWRVSLSNSGNETLDADLIYVQDVGIAERETVKAGENYVSRYIDHAVFEDKEHGCLICSRQNLEQGGGHPWLMSGCLDGAAGFLTDGGQFYGGGFKESGIPGATRKRNLDNILIQHEFSCHVLQSKTFRLAPAGKISCSFFSLYDPDHEAVSSHDDLKRIPAAADFTEPSGSGCRQLERCPNIFSVASLYPALEPEEEELERYFGKERKHVETRGGELLSFFTASGSHVVMKCKELLSARPHGHILLLPSAIYPDDDILSATAWMYGVFNSHLACGNTLFNKCLGVARGAHNFLRSAGQRIIIDTDNGYKLLGLPSAFEMGINFCRWIYKGRHETIIVRTWTATDSPSVMLDVRVDGDSKHDLIITHNLVMGSAEYESETEVFYHHARRRITVFSGKQTEFGRRFPDHRFDISVSGVIDFEIGGDELVFTDGRRRGYPFAVIVAENTDKITLALSASANWREFDEFTGNITARDFSFEESCRHTGLFWRELYHGAELSGGDDGGAERLNDILPWYAHNAMIHFAAPHGLEQYSGGGWRIRDVCRGTVKFFTALGRHDIARRIVCEIFSRQYAGTARWPRWFMFDRYYQYQLDHGDDDIIIWPLKAACEYIEASNDFSILDERLPYTTEEFNFTKEKEPLSMHIERLLDAVEDSFISGTELTAYRAGDWHDGFLPMAAVAVGGMISSGTAELLYQTMNRYSEVCMQGGISDDALHITALAARIKTDFNKYLVKNGITAGFARLNEDLATELVFHPDDSRTGVAYYLPSAAGGIISGIFSPEQAEAHFRMIREQLLLPDGAHLMNAPPVYRGGINRFFRHAEPASFSGRESGTTCIQAHLWYCEALAKLGKAEELYQGLLAANPIGLGMIVPETGIRQSNCYFCSSDAAFNDRRQASAGYELFRQGKITAEGGWRIYSGGPGTFIALLQGAFLGIRNCYGKVVMDPVIPVRLGNIIYKTRFNGKAVTFKYKLERHSHSPEKITVNGTSACFEYSCNPYRRGGAALDRNWLYRMLDREINIIEVIL